MMTGGAWAARRAGPAGALVAVVMTCGCATPSSATRDYTAGAAQSAADAVSAGRTAVVAADTYRRGMLPGAALQVLLDSSQDTLTSTATSFGSMQPPSTASADAVHAAVQTLLTTADQQAERLRIAAHRRQSTQLSAARDALAMTCDRLAEFAREHQR
jgi:hypothetical protein